MVAKRSPRSFPIEAKTRSPAAELGPRAVRTRTLIMDTARELFLAKGYGGVTIDDIVDKAGISRGSFYTYFPSKRDVLFAIGEFSYSAARDAAERFGEIQQDWTEDDIADWVSSFLTFLDEHGVFMLVWTQATTGDETLREVGLRTHLAVARRLGRNMALVSGLDRAVDPALEGLAVLALIERLWQFWRVARAPYSRRDVVSVLTGMIVARISTE
jgi:AcrR family transcriptional regulator